MNITKQQWRDRMREVGRSSWSDAGKASARKLTKAQRVARALKASNAAKAKRAAEKAAP